MLNERNPRYEIEIDGGAEADTSGAAYEARAQDAWKCERGGQHGTEHSGVPIGYAT